MGVRRYQGGVLVDTGELNAHVFALRSSGKIILKPVKEATQLAASRVQGVARQAFSGTRYWRGYPSQITYDVEAKGTRAEAEIGPVMGVGKQGSFGHWLEYGTSRQGPIKPHLGPALSYNEPIYEQALLAAAVMTTQAVAYARPGRVKK